MTGFPKPGEIFNQRYELLEVLGSGGIGTVFKALQREAGRHIALKIMHPDISDDDDEFKQRFLREARVLNQLSHPGIVTIYHLGLSETGLAYIAMELIRGASLRQLLKNETRLPALRAIAITRQLCQALSYVHEHGIVHRDIKPENIIIVNKPEPDTVKLIDFGLARLTTDKKLTQTGLLIGSASYMSPEQCKGTTADLRSDIYSLALCFSELLTGKKPFTADSPVTMMYKQINEPLAAIGKNQVDRFSPLMNKIISRASAKSPAERYQNMSDLDAALSALAQDLEGVQTSAQELQKRRIASLAIIAGICAAGAAVLVHCRMPLAGSPEAAAKLPQTLTDRRKQTQHQRQMDDALSEVKRREKRYGSARSSEARVFAAKQLFASLCLLSRKQLSSGDALGAENTVMRAMPLCSVFETSSENSKAAVFDQLALCKMSTGDLKSAESILNNASTCKQLTPATKIETTYYRSLFYLRSHRFKEAREAFLLIAKGAGAAQDLEKIAGERAFLNESYYVTDAFNLYEVVSSEKLEGDQERLAVLNFMNEIDAFMLNHKARKCAAPLNYSDSLLRAISPGIAGFKPVACKTYELLCRFELEFNRDPAAASGYRQKAELLSGAETHQGKQSRTAR